MDAILAVTALAMPGEIWPSNILAFMFVLVTLMDEEHIFSAYKLVPGNCSTRGLRQADLETVLVM